MINWGLEGKFSRDFPSNTHSHQCREEWRVVIHDPEHIHGLEGVNNRGVLEHGKFLRDHKSETVGKRVVDHILVRNLVRSHKQAFDKIQQVVVRTDQSDHRHRRMDAMARDR